MMSHSLSRRLHLYFLECGKYGPERHSTFCYPEYLAGNSFEEEKRKRNDTGRKQSTSGFFGFIFFEGRLHPYLKPMQQRP